jgi:NADH-quinone oxidoreductase subunit B
MKRAKWGAATNLPDVWRLASRPDARIQVLGAGLACCSLEVEAAAALGLLVRQEVDADDAPAGTVVVVAGTITEVLEPAVERLYAESARRGPVKVLSFGACATSGGPYWDAPTVANGLGAISVESYVPGCPPRPQALVAELERLVDAMAPA